jgi:hypothetical protein
MVWFKVTDKLHSDSKIRKLLAIEPAALALWTVAGSWCSDNLTDGFVPDHQLPWLIPQDAEKLAQALCITRIWKRVRGGYSFIEWTSNESGTKLQPSRAEVQEARLKKAEAGRKGGLASGKSRSKPEASASANAAVFARGMVELPTRPEGSGSSYSDLEGGRAVTRGAPPNPKRCPKHQNTPNPPNCGPCGDARHNTEAAEAAKRERLAQTPQCPHHRGQPADNCANCRADAIASPTKEHPLITPGKQP